MDRNTKSKIAAEAKRRIPKLGTSQKKVAQDLGVSESRLSRCLGGQTFWKKAEDYQSLAELLSIDIKRLEVEAEEELGLFTVAYCPRFDCAAASMFATPQGVRGKPFFHSPAIEFCPFFCEDQPLQLHCLNQDCRAGIRIGAFRCGCCGTTYLDQPVVSPDWLQREEYVRTHMAVRDQIVQEYLAARRTRSGFDHGHTED